MAIGSCYFAGRRPKRRISDAVVGQQELRVACEGKQKIDILPTISNYCLLYVIISWVIMDLDIVAYCAV